jgi:hypothetical protein
MKKKIFAFEDQISAIAAYEKLNFTVEIDDAANGIFYVEADLSDYGWLSTLAVLEDCQRFDLEPSFQFGDKMMTIQEAIEFADEQAAEEEYLINQLPIC